MSISNDLCIHSFTAYAECKRVSLGASSVLHSSSSYCHFSGDFISSELRLPVAASRRLVDTDPSLHAVHCHSVGYGCADFNNFQNQREHFLTCNVEY